MKKLIWTSANDSMGNMLIQWVLSLRSLGNYSGDLLVLDYGLNNYHKEICEYYKVELKPMQRNGFIVNQRYLDIIDIIQNYEPECFVAHFDADIWFQKDINLLFELIKNNKDGCVFSPDASWYSQVFLGSDKSQEPCYNIKRDAIKTKYGGTIQGGFSAGLNKNIIQKYNSFKNLFEKKIVKDEYGTDQFAFNLLFDTEKDTGDAHLLNCIGADIVCNNGTWFSKKYPGALQECVGIHIIGMLRNDIHRYFKYRHTNFLKPWNFKNNSTNTIYLEKLPISNHLLVEQQLIDIIEVCQKYYGYSLTIGFKENEILLSSKDIGCTGLVPSTHGNIHYWDRINLSRRQHLANPEKLFLSEVAVKTISQIDKNYPKILCDKFENHWLDFMLSMMLAEHNLSYGMVL